MSINDSMQHRPPKGWLALGSDPNDYQSGVDREVYHSGTASGYLKSIVEDADGFGNLMQEIQAKEYLEKRVKLSAYIKTENVEDWAGLWMRVTDKSREILCFDNMQDRPIGGTTDWAKYEVVLDVPGESETIAFGILLDGKGQIWVDDVALEEVEKNTALTGMPVESSEPVKPPTSPVNLRFED
jgi:hypothetical protein